MRPFTDVGYEGRANIYSAFALAVSPEAAGRGTMIAFNDRIVSAHWASKYHANAPVRSHSLALMLLCRDSFLFTRAGRLQRRRARQARHVQLALSVPFI